MEFRVPRFTTVTKAIDADYVVYGIRYGGKADVPLLKMMFGPLVGGGSEAELQNNSIQWHWTDMTCQDRLTVSDWRGAAEDGRRWRHVAVPLGGYAAYEGVPPKAGDYFDRIFDTMCCGQCAFCKQ